MNGPDGAEPHREIVIVRRAHSDHDEGHHGGAWKIAFADFMTAMMCFFLVMWLISAANEQTKAAVASYFNPVKLVDRNASRKGLEELGDGPNSVGLTAENPQEASAKGGSDGRGNAGPSTEKNSAEASEAVNRSDEHLFADPYAVLAEIAQDTGTKANISERGEGGAQDAGPANGASGGEAYRDPFAPDFWTEQVATPAAEASAERAAIEGEPAKPGDKTERSEKSEPVKAQEPQAPQAQAKLAKHVPGFFYLVHWGNTGAAFSFMSGRNDFFIVLSIVATLVLFVLNRRGAFADALSRWGAGLLMGGIFGNLADRLAHGHVVDFLLFYLRLPYANPWPAFNVADSCICTAVGLFLIASFREEKVRKAAAKAKIES